MAEKALFSGKEPVYLFAGMPDGLSWMDFANKQVAAVGNGCKGLKQCMLVICRGDELDGLKQSAWRMTSPAFAVVEDSGTVGRGDPAIGKFPEIQEVQKQGGKQVILVGWPETPLLARLLAENKDIKLFTKE